AGKRHSNFNWVENLPTSHTAFALLTTGGEGADGLLISDRHVSPVFSSEYPYFVTSGIYHAVAVYCLRLCIMPVYHVRIWRNYLVPLNDSPAGVPWTLRGHRQTRQEAAASSPSPVSTAGINKNGRKEISHLCSP